MAVSKLLVVPLFLACLVPAFATSWNSQSWCPSYSGLIFEKTAAQRWGLNDVFASYRQALGGIDNGNNPGKFSGFRSINWDGAQPFDMPGDFFKNTVTRGAEFLAAENKFAVSNPPSGVYDNRFSSFHPSFPNSFKTFSPPRLFTPVKSNHFYTLFSVPKSANGDRAHVSGFAGVFTNVKLWGKTFIHFYDKNDCLILRLPIKPKASGLSFGGIVVTKKNGAPVDAAIAYLKITLGTGIMSQPILWKNFVAMDDMIYGEPLPIDN